MDCIEKKSDIIRFCVSGEFFEIDRRKILKFSDSFLTKIVEQLDNKNIGVETIDEAIVIKRDSKYFGKILDICNDPDITLLDLLGYKYGSFEVHWFYTHIDIRGKYNFLQNLTLNYFFDTNLFNKEEFDIFLIEMDFYNIYPDCFKYREIYIDVSHVRNYISNKLYEANIDSINFFRKIETLDACISGSLVLESITNDSWNSSDIDIYINELSLYRCLNYCDSYNARGLLSKYNKMSVRRQINDSDLIINLFTKFMSEFNITNIEFCTYDNSEDPYDNGYGIQMNLCYVIKFKINNLKFDLVVVSCTPRFFINQFDFTFNSVFYDGYCVYVARIESIEQRQSFNYFARNRYNISEERKYIYNIGRILKYLHRGFMVFKCDEENISY